MRWSGTSRIVGWSLYFCAICFALWRCAAPSVSEEPRCERDDQCPLGQICRQERCLLPPRSDASSTEVLTSEQLGSEQWAFREGMPAPDAPCFQGRVRRCYTGPTAQPQGECRAGTQRCTDGKWGACENELKPSTERCNGKDDDCDGKLDNRTGSGQALRRDCHNQCGKGQEQCFRGVWQKCDAPQPKLERCNGLDDDCDGKIDNRLVAPLCRRQKGVCVNARQRCLGTKGWQACNAADYIKHSGQSYQVRETLCDGKDNDCNGSIDPSPACVCKLGDTRLCYNGPSDTVNKGNCHAGRQQCEGKAGWSECDGVVLPRTERCNNIDDDCDGQIDNRLVQPCRTACRSGEIRCVAGKWKACDAPQPKTEVCNNKDDDCDGKVDNQTGTPNNPLEQSCRNTCGTGKQQCLQGRWAACDAPRPRVEVCNNKDDDCDGKVDNGLIRACQSPCGTGQELCFQGQWRSCTAPQPQAETCNNKDDDCDGKIDDLGPRACRTKCGAGQERCTKGSWNACSARTPAPEICNGIDDNCDGKVDELCFRQRLFLFRRNVSFLPALNLAGSRLYQLDTLGQLAHTDTLTGKALPLQPAPPQGLVGFAQSQQTLSLATGQVSLFATARRTTTGRAQIQLYTQRGTVLSTLSGVTHTQRSAGQLSFDTAKPYLYVLDPAAKQLTRGQWQQQANSLRVTWSQSSLATGLRSPTHCQPTRFVSYGDELAVACTGWTWWTLSATVPLLLFPTPQQLSVSALPQRHLWVQYTHQGKLHQRTLSLDSPPTEITWAMLQNKRHLVVATAGRYDPSQRKFTSGQLYLYAWPPLQAPQRRAVPASNSKLYARPFGIRATKDGLLLLTVQEYQQQIPFPPHQGKLYTLPLATMFKGPWVPYQHFTQRNLASYLSLSGNGTHAAASFTSSQTHDLLILYR